MEGANVTAEIRPLCAKDLERLTVCRLNIFFKVAVELQLRHEPGTQLGELGRCSSTSHADLESSVLQDWTLIPAKHTRLNLMTWSFYTIWEYMV